mgnify:CR=1 FL=1
MSELRVDSVKSKGGGAPDLPKGVTISGITTAVTLGATQIDVSNVNVSGVVTSGTLSGDLLSTGTPTLGLGVTINSSGLHISGVATAGIVSATTLYGDGSNLSGVGASIAPLFYNPDPYDTGVTFDSGIGITFNSQVKAGTGNVTLSIANAGVAGTVVENFGVGSSVSISENKITINPTADLSEGGDYIISYPSGCFTNNEGTDYVGTAYTFQARVYNNELWMWGRNNYGQSGQNNTVQYSSPVQIPGTNWSGAIASSDAAFAIKSDNTLWVWGQNWRGRLGQNSPQTTNLSSPVQIPGTWSHVNAGGNGTLAINTDGELWSWGYNYVGFLGQNNTIQYSSPVQVGSETTWSQTTGMTSKHGIKTDGTLWSWGYNNVGGLGQNNKTDYSSPVQIPGTNWSKVSSGHRQTAMAIKTDGTLWGWGSGNNKVLNSSDNNAKSSPIQIPGTTWKTVYQYSEGIAGFKTDGTLWMWGYNHLGQLGQNSLTTYSSPIQIPGTTWTGDAFTGPNWILATKTDGTLWSWGANDTGNLGQNQEGNNISSLTQLGSDTTWDYSKLFYMSYAEADTSIGIKQI